MKISAFLAYLACMAVITYLVRALPLVFVKKKIKNRFLLSFLDYMPYAVLSAMTVPAVFYATGDVLSAAVGVITALVLSFFKKSLLLVAACASLAVLLTQIVLTYCL